MQREVRVVKTVNAGNGIIKMMGVFRRANKWAESNCLPIDEEITQTWCVHMRRLLSHKQ